MTAQIKRMGGIMNWNSRTSIGIFIAVVSLALAMLFGLGLGRDNFWDGVMAGFFTVVLFAAVVYVMMKWAAASSVSSRFSPSGISSSLSLK